MASLPPPKVVLVTGCSAGGIGFELCKELRKQGCVVWAASRSKDSMSELQELGCRLLVVDVTKQETIDAAVQEVLATEGRIDVLINNAGIMLCGSWLDTTIEDMRSVFETNLWGLVAVTKAVAGHMVERRAGLVVNVGSCAGYVHAPFMGAYSASKAAVDSLSTSLRLELAPFGVKVMYVAPGSVTSRLGPGMYEAAEPRFKGGPYAPIWEDLSTHVRKQMAAGHMPADVFAQRMVQAVLSRSPPNTFVEGGQSGQVQFMTKLMPRWATDMALSNVFKLGKLASLLKAPPSKPAAAEAEAEAATTAAEADGTAAAAEGSAAAAAAATSAEEQQEGVKASGEDAAPAAKVDAAAA